FSGSTVKTSLDTNEGQPSYALLTSRPARTEIPIRATLHRVQAQPSPPRGAETARPKGIPRCEIAPSTDPCHPRTPRTHTNIRNPRRRAPSLLSVRQPWSSQSDRSEERRVGKECRSRWRLDY